METTSHEDFVYIGTLLNVLNKGVIISYDKYLDKNIISVCIWEILWSVLSIISVYDAQKHWKGLHSYQNKFFCSLIMESKSFSTHRSP